MTRLFDALHRGVRGFGHAREGRGWAWWRAPWKRCLLASACPPCPCPPLWTWCPRNSSSLKVRYNTNQTPLLRLVYSSLCLLSACPDGLTACCVLSVHAVLKTISSSSPGAPETRPLGRADLFMLTSLCLLTGALMLTGKLTNHYLVLLNSQVSALLTSIVQLCGMR